MYWFQKGADVSRVVDDEGYPTYSSMEQVCAPNIICYSL